MARRTSNTLAVITWIIGLLGCLGYVNTLGFFPLIIPILFWMFGNRLTKDHCRDYFNVLITAIIIYLVGAVLDQVLDILKIHTFSFIYVAVVYFAINCIAGLLAALNTNRYNPQFVARVFK